MATYLFKGTSHSGNNYLNYIPYAYDKPTVYGDTSTAAEAILSSTQGSIFVIGCDNSAVLEKVNAGEKIKSLKLHCVAKKYGSSTPSKKYVTGQCVYDVSGTAGVENYTSAGDPETNFVDALTTTATEYTISFPKSAEYFNNNPSKFSKIAARFWGYYFKLYDLWWEITLEPISTISTAVSPTGSGTVSGGGQYANGSSVTLTATPNTGYRFVKWSDGNTSNPRTVTANGNATYTAVFEIIQCTVTTIVSPEDGGTVTGAGTYEYGTSVTLTATPNDGYKFVKWSDGVATASRTFTVTSSVTYTAVFEPDPPKFTEINVLYNSKQVSETNKVPAGQKFIVAVGVK